MKANQWKTTTKHQFFQVTSSLKITNWLQLAIQQLSYYQNIKYSGQSSKIIGQQYQKHQQLKNKDEYIEQEIDYNKLLYSHIKIYDGKPTILFSNQSSLIALTKCILRVVFGIQWSLPISNLCPRVPNRMNYLIWIDSYIIKNQLSFQSSSKSKDITCLDIGTGASLIYPLLGTKLFGWKFIATQKDYTSYEHAYQLIILNHIQSFIQLRKNTSPYLLIYTINLSQKINFVLCNPPFFDSQDENIQPLGVMTSGQHNTLGGEYEFFFSLYVQSFYFPNIEWFTMMIGLGRDFWDIKFFLERQVEQFGVLQQVRFGKINQSDNSRFIIAWRTNKKMINNSNKSIIQYK